MLGKSVGQRDASAVRRHVRRARWAAKKSREFVEESDCVMLLGAFMTDINLGIYTANLDPRKCIYATSEQLRIRHHHFHDVLLARFHPRADRAPDSRPRRGRCRRDRADERPFVARAPTRRSPSRRLDRAAQPVAGRLMVVIADIGDALFAATRTGDPSADRVHRPGVLHLDGLCRAGGAGRDGRPARPAPGGAGRRRRVPDDRHGAVDHRPPRLLADRDRAGQQGLRHRAVAASGRHASTTFIPGTITSCRRSSAAGPATRSAPRGSSTRPCSRPGPTAAA